MNLQSLFATAALAFSVIQALSPKIADSPIVAFPEHEPKSTFETSTLRFKPWATGCFALPAVNEKGEVPHFKIDPMSTTNTNYQCQVKPTDTKQQVYGRSDWVKGGLWGMMYSYYYGLPVQDTYAFQSIVVFINNPAVKNPNIIACSFSLGKGEYVKYTPCPKEYIEGDTVKLEERSLLDLRLSLTTAAKTLETQNLIMWEHLPNASRDAFNEIALMPMNEHNFKTELQNANLLAKIGSYV